MPSRGETDFAGSSGSGLAGMEGLDFTGNSGSAFAGMKLVRVDLTSHVIVDLPSNKVADLPLHMTVNTVLLRVGRGALL